MAIRASITSYTEHSVTLCTEHLLHTAPSILCVLQIKSVSFLRRASLHEYEYSLSTAQSIRYILHRAFVMYCICEVLKFAEKSISIDIYSGENTLEVLQTVNF